jgi:hypothetical protein
MPPCSWNAPHVLSLLIQAAPTEGATPAALTCSSSNALLTWQCTAAYPRASYAIPPLLPAGLDFVFHMFFLVKYCKSLEEGEAAGTWTPRSTDAMSAVTPAAVPPAAVTPAGSDTSRRRHSQQ